MKNGMKWLGTAAILLLSACKDKDPLKTIRPLIEIRAFYDVQETGGGEYETYIGGTVTNNSNKDLTDVVLYTTAHKPEGKDPHQYFNIGDLPAGESRDFSEFHNHGATFVYHPGEKIKPCVWLYSATVAGAKP